MYRMLLLTMILMLLIPQPVFCDDDDIEGLFGSLAIGEEKGDDGEMTRIDKALKEAENYMKTNDFDMVLELCEQVLKKEPTHTLALRYKSEAKRKKFWKEWGNIFILALILVVIVPSAWRILERIRTGR